MSAVSRLALAVAALVVAAGPVAAEEPSADVQKVLEAMAAGQYVEWNCLAYRPNTTLIGSALIEAGVAKEDLQGKYSDFVRKTDDIMQAHGGMEASSWCDFLYDFYHSQGTGPYAIEKR